MCLRIHVVLIAFLVSPLTYAADDVDELKMQVDQLGQHEDPPPVDLTPQQRLSIDDNEGSNVLENPWWRNFDIAGFGAVGFYDTGSAGTRDHGGFEIKEASLFVTADVWDDVEFFVELQTNRLGNDSSLFTRTGEVYVHVHDILRTDTASIG